ncbi:ATP-binding cassette domain-containing protein [Flavobacteriaceae bacterium Ap0902]|nr:ATP-binding cassette domain-containing protein [Flavobacteriaceae bacterium Ap0902]
MMQRNTEKRSKRSFQLQQDQSDCGVACLKSIMQFYEGNATLEKLRELSGTNITGTTVLGLYQAANKIGFDAQGNEADIQAIIDHGEPLILHVLIEGKLQHYVVCYGYDENKGFLIGDPAKGISYYSIADLVKVWKSKVCITLTPNKNFVKIKQFKRSKISWYRRLLIEDKKLLIFSLLLGVGIAVLNMATAIFSQKLIDKILPSKEFPQLIGGIALLGFLLLVRVAFSSLRSYLLTIQTQDFNNRIIRYFYSNILALPKPFFDTRKIGELTARLNDTNRIQRVIKLIVSSFVIDVLMVITSFSFLIFYSWQIGIVAMITMPVYFLLIYSFNHKIIHAQKQVMQGYAMSESHFISTMQGIDVIKNYDRVSMFDKLNQRIYGAFQEKVFNLELLNIKIGVYSGLAAVVFLITIISIASTMVWDGQMLLGELVAVLSIASLLLPAITNLALITIPINEAKIAFDRMFEYTSLDKEASGEEILNDFKSLEIIDLTFRFPGRSPLFHHVNFSINKGEIILLSGDNGSGKSTLSQILQKFYSWESGDIIINKDKLLQDISLESWRKIIGVLPQEINLFQGNVIDNILLGDKLDERRWQLFIEEYNFVPFLKSLPQGLSTIIGEEGVNLSGGQKQMLGMMRVLYKEPQLLILDEPTASMDEANEEFIIDLLSKINKTTFIVSHRNAKLEKIADKKLFLSGGILREN